MNVLIAGGGTGGHLMPALALAQALREARSSIDPVLVGARRGVEADILPTRPFRFHLVPAEPIYRRQWWRNFRWPFLLPTLMARCRAVLDAERPVLAVGTGGYVSGPILSAAHRRGIPLALQEQNAYPGITTRRLAGRAKQIHLGFPEAEELLHPGPDTMVFTLGNPIVLPDTVVLRKEGRRALGVDENAQVVLVMGGSQGALALNEAVAQGLRGGALAGVTVLWSTGPAHYERYREYQRPGVVLVRPFWDPIAEAYAVADLVVARSGAMSTAELLAWGLPSVLVPLPSAAADHQTKNAVALAGAGSAVMLPERELAPERLAAIVRELLSDRDRLERMSRAARERGRPAAAREIAEKLLELVP